MFFQDVTGDAEQINMVSDSIFNFLSCCLNRGQKYLSVVFRKDVHPKIWKIFSENMVPLVSAT